MRLLDETAEADRRRCNLPETFSKLVLLEKGRPRTASEIEARYRLPRLLAEQYASVAPFFSQLRHTRDAIIHGGCDLGLVFDTERGFCIDPKRAPFSSFRDWQPEHHYNENLVSVLPWIADMILSTIQACNALMEAFASAIRFPPEIAPGYHVFVRGPQNDALLEVLNVHSGGTPWWG